MRLAHLIACLCAAWLAAVLPAGAQGLQPPVFDENALRAYVSQQLVANGAQMTRFEVQLGSLDTRYAMAPCRRTEPFLPAGARPWGRISLGVRCTDGANWTVMLPLTVRAWGPALVAAAPLAAGSVPGAQDVQIQEIELTREPASLLRDAVQLQGRTLSRAVMPGQALRADMLRATLVIQSGDPVRLRLAGTGFAVSATGQALGPAAEGQSVRVRTELGKLLTGVAREGRLVDVTL